MSQKVMMLRHMGKNILEKHQKYNDAQLQIWSILLASILYIFGLIILWSNERAAIKPQKLRNKLQKQIREISAQDDDESLEGKLVMITGKLHVQEPIRDPITSIQVQNSLYLRRRVQIFQGYRTSFAVNMPNRQPEPILYSNWVEYKNSDYIVEQEQQEFVCTSQILYSSEVYLGIYKIPQDLVETFNNDLLVKRVTLKEEMFNKELYQQVKQQYKGHNIYIEDNTLYIKKIKERDSFGDIRVFYETYESGDCVALGKKFRGTLEPYVVDLDGNIIHIEESNLRCAEIDQGIDSFCKIACFCCYRFLDPLHADSDTDRIVIYQVLNTHISHQVALESIQKSPFVSNETFWVRRVCGFGIHFSSFLICSISFRSEILSLYLWTDNSIITFSFAAAIISFVFFVSLPWIFHNKGIVIVVVILTIIIGLKLFFPIDI